MNKKLLTQAITLGLLVAAPYNVWRRIIMELKLMKLR